MLKYLLEKEFKQIMRNKFIPKMIIAMPLFMMLIMPWAANQEVTNIRLTVVDNDRSVTSDELVRKVVSSGYFIFQSVSDGSEEALRDVDAGKADIILDIPDGFEKNLLTERVSGVMISGIFFPCLSFGAHVPVSGERFNERIRFAIRRTHQHTLSCMVYFFHSPA